MALITCPECGKLISDQIEACPQCGHLFYRTSATDREKPAVYGEGIGSTAEAARLYNGQSTVTVVKETQRWGAGATVAAVMLLILQAALLYFLYLNIFKWPYDNAKEYYAAEKASYEQMVNSYESIAQDIAQANEELDFKIEELRSLVDSGDEPQDPATKEAAMESIKEAQAARIETPSIQAADLPSILNDSPFHAREILQTGRVIDQERYALFNAYGSLLVPNYSRLIANMEKSENDLTESIRQQKSAEQVSPELKKTIDQYESFIKEYCDFLKARDLNNPADNEKAATMSGQYTEMTARFNAIDRSRLSAQDAKYLNEASFRISVSLAEVSALLP